MPPLKARQERFCRRFVELACAATAARAAGFAPKGSKVAGYRLLRHPRIAARIAEIEAQTARLHSRSSEVLIGKLENVYRRAVVDHQFHAAARAVDLQAQIRREAGRVPASARRHDASAVRPGAPSETAAAAPVPAATRNDYFCFGEKTF
jgi:phage terminase small subunit